MHRPLGQPVFSPVPFSGESQQYHLLIEESRATLIHAALTYSSVSHSVPEMISPEAPLAIQHGGSGYGYDYNHNSHYILSAAVDDTHNPPPATPYFPTPYMNPRRINVSDLQCSLSQYSAQQAGDNCCHGLFVQPSDLHWRSTQSQHSDHVTQNHPHGAGIALRPVSQSVVYQSLAHPGNLAAIGKEAPRRTPIACLFCRKRKVGPTSPSSRHASLTTSFC